MLCRAGESCGCRCLRVRNNPGRRRRYPEQPSLCLFRSGFNDNQEFSANTAQSQDVLASQARYRTDKAELDAALGECSKKPAHCPVPLKAFAKMIGNLKKFSDNTLLRALIDNAWLNSSIIYESEEARGAQLMQKTGLLSCPGRLSADIRRGSVMLYYAQKFLIITQYFTVSRSYMKPNWVLSG
jgi:hypothetical protein